MIARSNILLFILTSPTCPCRYIPFPLHGDHDRHPLYFMRSVQSPSCFEADVVMMCEVIAFDRFLLPAVLINCTLDAHKAALEHLEDIVSCRYLSFSSCALYMTIEICFCLTYCSPFRPGAVRHRELVLLSRKVCEDTTGSCVFGRS